MAAVSMPAREPTLIGGDFHDVLVLPGDLVVILMGDVAGKGIEAAGMTETVRSAIRTLSLISPSPEYILRHVNDLLLLEPGDESFVTALLVMLDLSMGQAFLASAGHPPPVHISGGKVELLELPLQPPLGAFQVPFKSARLPLLCGDTLVLYTDGVTEARRDGELFGEERLVQVVEGLRGGSVDELAQGIADAAQGFGGQLRDDLQVVVVRLS